LNFELSLGGILVLDDALEQSVGGANDAAVTGGVVCHRRKHGCRKATVDVRLEKCLNGVDLEHRHIPAGNHDCTVKIGWQCGQPAFNRSASARHVVLIGDFRSWIKRLNVFGQNVTLVANNWDDVRSAKRVGGG
jgi:hypothetical protein